MSNWVALRTDGNFAVFAKDEAEARKLAADGLKRFPFERFVIAEVRDEAEVTISPPRWDSEKAGETP
jgi:hypothetical protein